MKAIISLFDDNSDATSAISELTSMGVSRDNIQLVDNHYPADVPADSNIIPMLTRLGVPNNDARNYQEVVRRGTTLVATLVPDNQLTNAQGVLDRFQSGVGLEERVSRYRQTGYNDYDETAPMYSQDEAKAERDQMRIPIVEEQLSVGKREVEGGGVRVISRVIETPVEEQIRLREEFVKVERRAVNRVLTGAELNNAFKEGTIEMTERSEVAVVSKDARVVEEVVIGKESTERTETVRDSVRRTDVEVVENGNTTVSGSTTMSGNTTTKR